MVGKRLLGLRLEETARDVDGAGDMPLLPLVEFAYVEQDRRIVALEQTGRRSRVHFVDLGLDLLQEVAVAGHWFQKYSFTVYLEKSRLFAAVWRSCDT